MILSPHPMVFTSLTSLILTLSSAGVAFAMAVSPGRKRNSRKESALLRKIIEIISAGPDLDTGIGACLDEILAATGLDAGGIRFWATPGAASVGIYRGFNDPLIQALGNAPIEIPEEPGAPASKTWKHANADRLGEDLSVALQAENLGFFAWQPMYFRNRLLGVFMVAARGPESVAAIHEDFFAVLTGTLALAIGSARQLEQADKLSDDLIALHEIIKIISQSLHLDEIIRRIVIEGRRLIKTCHCHLFLLNEPLRELVGTASTEQELNIQSLRFKLAEPSKAVDSLVQKRAIAVESFLQAQNHRWGSAIFAPLIAKEGAIGVLVCSDDSAGRAFTVEEISRAETLAHQAAIALENARLFDRVSRSQREWESTFDAMQDCVSVHDTSGKIIRANVALARRLKTTPPKMIGKTCAEIYNPAQLTFSPCRHMDALPSSESLFVEELEIAEMRGTFQLSISPWYDKNNRLVGSIHVAKDVSNEKLLRQQLIQSEKLSAIGELISGIAHELNNPLTGVMGYSQLLQLRKDLDERAHDSLLKINNLAMRCQKIVQNLLSFARKQKPERTLSNINDILERTIELRNYELAVNNITIERDLDHDLPKTIADGHQLQQVFLNVITNAEQAMLNSHGRGHLAIRSYLDRPNNRIVVEIVDDGPGITEANLSRIFDPFFTTKEVGKGTGLGLSLSYGIIKEHGGNIYALGRPGGGAIFVIELPVITNLADEAIIFPELAPQAVRFDSLVRDKRILIVDDEQYILDFFVEIFRSYSMHVDTAGNGLEATKMLSENLYHLVITDFKMPQMSGRELYYWIRDQRPELTKRIIFVTGDTVSTETRSFFEQNYTPYLAKPFKIEEVKEAIQQILDSAAEN